MPGLRLKLESEQVSGSFKPRGGFNKILTTREQGGPSDFIAPTAGGHGVGLSYAARATGTTAHIYLPETADPSRIRDIRANGATMTFFPSVVEAAAAARATAEREGFVYVSAYDDTQMIEGGGTIAPELIEQLPDLDCLVCSGGGGGYLAGMAIVLKQLKPDLTIIGVQQEGAGVLAEWHRTGRYPADFELHPSLAEGVGGPVPETVATWEYLRDLVDEFVLVTEDDIAETVLAYIDGTKRYVEPSGVVGLAAIRRDPTRFADYSAVCTVITGRNMSVDKLRTITSR